MKSERGAPLGVRVLRTRSPKKRSMCKERVAHAKSRTQIVLASAIGIWSFLITVILACSRPALADKEHLFDPGKLVILPSEAAAPILQRRRAGNDWTISNCPISSQDLDKVEHAMTVAKEKPGSGLASFELDTFYRQYMPAQWKGLRIISVNAFDKSASDLFPNRGISPDQWKHELVTAFGGGCAYWNAVYVVEQNRLMVLKNNGSSWKRVGES